MRTAFQQRVLTYLNAKETHSASTWEVARCAFPERWATPSRRGLLVSQVRRAGDALAATNDIAAVLPPMSAHGSHVLCRH